MGERWEARGVRGPRKKADPKRVDEIRRVMERAQQAAQERREAETRERHSEGVG